MRIDVLGVEFDDFAFEEAVKFARDCIESGEKTYVVTPNPEIVWMARRDDALRSIINGAGMVLPDGVGITLGARILGTPLRRGRIPGIDFASAMIGELAQFGGSIFLFGAKPGVAEAAGQKLGEKYPGLIIAGACDGYFTESAPIVDFINSAKPDVVLVCLGSPKQELWIAENIESLNAKLYVGLGGSLDVFAGKVKRAPAFFRKLGLEWLYRLFREPRRIKRMIKLPIFVFAVIAQALRRNEK